MMASLIPAKKWVHLRQRQQQSNFQTFILEANLREQIKILRFFLLTLVRQVFQEMLNILRQGLLLPLDQRLRLHRQLPDLFYLAQKHNLILLQRLECNMKLQLPPPPPKKKGFLTI
jgi:hypothetical protein